MPPPFHRPLRGISIHQIESYIPKNWRQSIEKSSHIQKKTNPVISIEFDEKPDNYMVYSLLTILKDFATQGHLTKASRIFPHIQAHALTSSSCKFIVESLSHLLLSCTQSKLFPEGKQIHAQVITWGLQKSHNLVPKLVSFYSNFNFLDEARFITVASNVLHPLPWNLLISSYVKNGLFDEAISAYKQMVYKGSRPDNFTFPSVLKACGEQSNLAFGREVHVTIRSASAEWNLFVQNALVSMYGKCGDLATARTVFDEMPVKDEVSWNSIISGYASMGKWDEAFDLFENMRASCKVLNVITWNTIAGGCLKTENFGGAIEILRQMRICGVRLDPVAVIIGLGACSHLKEFNLGKELHGLAIRNHFDDYVNVKNALITMYSRCTDLTRAYLVFRSVKFKSIITWNSMISGYAHWDLFEEASFLFREMLLSNIEPNFVTIASILPLCARVANIQHGKEFHCFIIKHKGFQDHLLLWNALIDMYSRSSKVSLARRIFDSLEKRDAVTYTSLIAGYGIQGEGKIAAKLFEEMIKSDIKPDKVAMVAVLSACSHSGLIAKGQFFFEMMQSDYDIAPNVEHYACMVDLYGRIGLLNKAREIIMAMPYKANSEMWATLLGACRIHGNMDMGEYAAEKLLEMKPSNPGYYVLIANMYAAAGNWNKLAEVRTFMRDLGVRKDPGCAWVDIGSGFAPFSVEDTSNRVTDEIYDLLWGLTKQMKDVCYGNEEESGLEKEVFLELLGLDGRS